MLSLSFSKIKNSNSPLTTISSEVEFDQHFFERAKDLILAVKKCQVEGQFFYQEPFVTGSYHVIASVTVPSSRSLKPVDLDLDFTFTENYSDHEPSSEEVEENDLIVPLTDDLIDLQTAVEDNLLLNLPIQALTEDEEKEGLFPEGDGWEVVSEDKLASSTGHPAFSNLKELLERKGKDQPEGN